MLALSNIRSIHLELTTACNARCPSCPRNVAGYQHNDGYPECDLTLSQIQTILSTEFLRQINHIYISGNFGDFLMNPQSIEILQYLRDHISPNSGYICIGTNGGARDKTFWQQVARLSDEVIFCIDGLDDTHSIYRKNTVYRTVINNAQTVIDSGGKASWKFIVFDHNRHQIDAARALSKELGFTNFYLHDHGRSQKPVFDKHGNFEHWIGEPQFEQVPKIEWILQDPQRLENFSEPRVNTVACESLKKQELYITANGEVYPCCFMGHYPHTFQQNMSTWYGFVNNQVNKIAMQNNALEHGLEKAIQWFSNIPDHWTKQNVQQRLIVCDTSCGESNPYQHDQNISNQ
jgi:MoaA/NifB/PqqE/SkfB family radical SAM enzyme